MKALFILTLLSFSPLMTLADDHPMCAPTGWSCDANQSCCSILDYCKFGTCTPNNQVFQLQSLQPQITATARCG